MARSFRLWEKKRGDRQTGSRLVGNLSEALFFFALFLLGSISLLALITLQIMHSTPEQLYISGWGLGLRLLVVLSFLLVGAVGFVLTVLHTGTSAERRAALAKRTEKFDLRKQRTLSDDQYPTIPSDSNMTNSPGTRLAFRLPIQHSRTLMFLISTAICIVSFGVTAILIVVAWSSFAEGSPDWLATVAAVPFAAIGVFAGLKFVRQLSMYVSVGPTTVEISDHPLLPGEEYRIFLAQAGQLSIVRLRISLVCEEEATFHQGTDVRTEIKPVFEQTLLREKNIQVRQGTPFEQLTEVTIPPSVMHSFQSRSNAVRWKVIVKATTKRWGAVTRSFPVVIFPGSGDDFDD